MQAPFIIASQSIIWVIAALLLLLFPARFTSLLGPDLSDYGLAVTRIFASELMGLAIASGVTRASVSCRRGLCWAYVTSNSLGFAVCLAAVLGDVMKPTAWALVVLYLIYALLFAYLLLTAQKQD